MKKFVLIFILASTRLIAFPQEKKSAGTSKWSNHFQFTTIAQKHSGFRSLYSGTNSIADTVEPTAISLTSTLFLGRKLWKGASVYLNPELSGGKGLSFATGVAGALNGETYRVGEVAPQVFVARAYFQQHIPLGGTAYEYVDDDINQVADKIPANRITIRAGKFGMSDFFDNNTYSKDPRTQFFNWSLWANGAWDYPADTRGYTYGVVTELIKPTWSLRLSSVAVPRIANFHLLEYNLSRAHSETVEVDHRFSLIKQPGKVRFTISNTYSQAPSYSEGLKALRNNNIFLLNVIQGNEEHKVYGGRKVSLGLNVEQQINNEIGFFSRVGWNDGKYVTWAFTEIDRTVNAGFSVKGIKWKRPDDAFGVAVAINGISKEHREFLKSGGYGFIIGDGTLNYGNEGILETYYRAQLGAMFSITFDYELVNHPAYNKDRGPVNAFGIRGHVQF